MEKVYIQITSGRGPAECCRVVSKVLELMLKEAKQQNIYAEVIEREEGEINRTLLSAILFLAGENLESFVDSWEGTVLWISQSPYRKFHKRKNWFIGVQSLPVLEENEWNESDLRFQTFKASGSGGQHVNKTESAVRVTHIPSGISVTASENRSQLQNKKQAIERLKIKLAAYEQQRILAFTQENWQNHNELERGNPVRTIKADLDR
ncbi:MAG: peptide chain release factor H [Candidatus Azobacteroides sp.]|nr:peptide chain release factor H [Candidatus Azobacteroides sp.]